MNQHNLRPLIMTLKTLGFVKDFESMRRSKDNARVVVFVREYGHRKVDVQLWGDGKHRVSHSHGGCSDTKPTYFKDGKEMFSAIILESARADSRYHPDNWSKEP